MSESFRLVCYVRIVTHGTGIGGIASVFTIGRCHYGLVAVSLCRHLVGDVGVTAIGTSIGGISCTLAGGECYGSQIVMLYLRIF